MRRSIAGRASVSACTCGHVRQPQQALAGAGAAGAARAPAGAAAAVAAVRSGSAPGRAAALGALQAAAERGDGGDWAAEWLERGCMEAIVDAAGAADARTATAAAAGARPGSAAAHEVQALCDAAGALLAAAPAGGGAPRRAVAMLRDALERGGPRCGAATLRLLLAALDAPAVCRAAILAGLGAALAAHLRRLWPAAAAAAARRPPPHAPQAAPLPGAAERGGSPVSAAMAGIPEAAHALVVPGHCGHPIARSVSLGTYAHEGHTQRVPPPSPPRAPTALLASPAATRLGGPGQTGSPLPAGSRPRSASTPMRAAAVPRLPLAACGSPGTLALTLTRATRRDAAARGGGAPLLPGALPHETPQRWGGAGASASKPVRSRGARLTAAIIALEARHLYGLRAFDNTLAAWIALEWHATTM